MIREIYLKPKDRIAAGVKKLAAAVKCTLGPQGRNVIIQNPFRKPTVTKDGVTVAEEIHVEDPVESEAIQVMKQAARRTGDEAGDGTTTATVLAEALYLNGRRAVEAGANPRRLKRGMDSALDTIVEYLEERKELVEDEDALKNVATIAANNDDKIGELIGGAMNRLGHDGVIVVQEGNGLEDELHYDQGMKLESGMMSMAFSDRLTPGRAEYTDPKVLVCQRRIATAYEVVPLLEHAVKNGEALFILCDDISPEALMCVATNRDKVRVCVVKAPDHAEFRRAIMEDVAAMTGATVISSDMDVDLRTLNTEGGYALDQFLGDADRITAGKHETVIVKGTLDDEGRQQVEARIAIIKNEMESGPGDYLRDKLQKRLARLSGGVARLYITAPTEAEMVHKKARVEDALFAAKAAADSGILPGGGIALARAITSLRDFDLHTDVGAGIKIVKDALSVPFKTIAENAGYEGSVLLERLRSKGDDFWEGYDFNEDASTEEPLVGDMRKFGIVDPTKVVTIALRNAISVADLLLNTEAVIVNTSEQDEALEQGLRKRSSHGQPLR